MGRLEEAHIDLENVVRKEPDNADANMLYTMISTLQVNFHVLYGTKYNDIHIVQFKY